MPTCALKLAGQLPSGEAAPFAQAGDVRRNSLPGGSYLDGASPALLLSHRRQRKEQR